REPAPPRDAVVPGRTRLTTASFAHGPARGSGGCVPGTKLSRPPGPAGRFCGTSTTEGGCFGRLRMQKRQIVPVYDFPFVRGPEVAGELVGGAADQPGDLLGVEVDEPAGHRAASGVPQVDRGTRDEVAVDRKSTRLNSSNVKIY